MSAFTVAKTVMKDLSALKKALTNMGFKEVELHSEPQNLYGYQNDKREQKANLIIRRKYVGSASNDIGFVQQADGTCQAVISQYDKSKYGDKWMKTLTQEYALAKLEGELQAQNFFLDKVTRKDGKIFITAENPYL